MTQASVARYLQIISDLIKQRQLRAAPGYIHLFPSTLIFTRTDTHYAFELLGSRRQHGPLLVKENSKISSFNRLVGSFKPSRDTIYLIGTGTPEPANTHALFANLTLTSLFDLDQIEARFPGFSDISPRTQFRSFNSAESFMPIDARSVRTLAIRKCYLISHVGRLIRPRYINFLFGESKQADKQEFVEDIGKYMNIPSNEMMGITLVPEGHIEPLMLAAEFASLYHQNVKETTLTQFLSDHQRIIKWSFGADKLFFEQSLQWIEGNPDPAETGIRPDVILRKNDGSWMVMDFKLPLQKSRITTGAHARRKFIFTVNDGISQLANYADYFNFAANRAAAARILGEQISNPDLTLVVGNDENVNMTEVKEAKRSYREVDIMRIIQAVR